MTLLAARVAGRAAAAAWRKRKCSAAAVDAPAERVQTARRAMHSAAAPDSQEVSHEQSIGHCPVVGRCLPALIRVSIASSSRSSPPDRGTRCGALASPASRA